MKVVKTFKIVEFGVRSCSCESRLFCALNSYRCHAEQIETGNNEIFFFAATRISCNFSSSLPFFFFWNGVDIYSNKFLYCL